MVGQTLSENQKDILSIIVSLAFSCSAFYFVLLFPMKYVMLVLISHSILSVGLLYFIWNLDNKHVKIEQSTIKTKNGKVLEVEDIKYCKEIRNLK